MLRISFQGKPGIKLLMSLVLILPLLTFLLSNPIRLRQLVPDFGPDGLAGLSPAEIKKLVQEEIVVPEEPVITEEGKTMIAASLIIRQPVERVWELLSRTEDQAKYLAEVRRALLLFRKEGEDRVRFEVEIMGVTVRYTVIHSFFPEIRAITWMLDPEAANDLKEFQGFWRLYPYREGFTLARYGSRVTPRFFLATWITKALYRQRVRSSLLAVKRYLEMTTRDSFCFP